MRQRWVRLAWLGSATLALALAAPVGAITNGEADDGEHPYVGQLFNYVPDEIDPDFDDPGSWFNCSGTLISPTVVLTAGHCTFGTGLNGEPTTDDGGWGGNDVWVSFDEESDYAGIRSGPFAPGDNAGRYVHFRDTLNANGSWHRGTAYQHEDFDIEAFYLADAGVVILDEPFDPPGEVDVARLPTPHYLDDFLGRTKAQTLFEAVGFGFESTQRKLPPGGDTRMKTEQVIVNANGVYGVHDGSSIVFSNNNGRPHQGGTCSGDSGGPFFEGSTNRQVAINSYAAQPNCTGGDGAYRLDQPDALSWIDAVLDGNDPRIE